MSLKAFHIVFISVATSFLVFFSWWCFSFSDSLLNKITGVTSIIATVILLVYGFWFYVKKIRDKTL